MNHQQFYRDLETGKDSNPMFEKTTFTCLEANAFISYHHDPYRITCSNIFTALMEARFILIPPKTQIWNCSNEFKFSCAITIAGGIIRG